MSLPPPQSDTPDLPPARPGGGASLAVQVFGPLAGATPTGDAGSILANPLRRDGDWIEVDIDTTPGLDWGGNPETGSVYWELPLVDMLGAALANTNLRGLERLEIEVDALLPAGVAVFACVRAGTIAASTRSYGAAIIGNAGTSNDGSRTERVGASWSHTNITGSAAVRRGMHRVGIYGNSQNRASSAMLYEADQTLVAQSISAPITTIQDYTGIAIAVAADVATPVVATARFRVTGSFLSEAQIRSP